jgi:hypothetical protein
MVRTAPPASPASRDAQTPTNAQRSVAKSSGGEFRELLKALRHGARPGRPDAGPVGAETRAAADPQAAEVLSVRVGERDGQDRGGGSQDGEREPNGPLDDASWSEAAVDPIYRALAQTGPRLPAAIEAATPAANAVLIPELEMLLSRLVKRAAWGGDGRKGTARLELGAGPLEGATLLVHAEDGELSIDLELPPGAATEEWRDRLLARLAARGLTVRELTVH